MVVVVPLAVVWTSLDTTLQLIRRSGELRHVTLTDLAMDNWLTCVEVAAVLSRFWTPLEGPKVVAKLKHVCTLVILDVELKVVVCTGLAYKIVLRVCLLGTYHGHCANGRHGRALWKIRCIAKVSQHVAVAIEGIRSRDWTSYAASRLHRRPLQQQLLW